MGIIHRSVPISSLLLLPTEKRMPYFDQLEIMPRNLRLLLFSPRTGAFIRGLTKVYNVPSEKAPTIALTVLKIAYGEKSLAQLASILSTELQLSNDKAQRIAQEIEKELFAPVMLELNQYLAQKKKAPTSPITTQPQASGARNVLDLKSQSRPPLPPAIPNR